MSRPLYMDEDGKVHSWVPLFFVVFIVVVGAFAIQPNEVHPNLVLVSHCLHQVPLVSQILLLRKISIHAQFFMMP